MQDVWITGIGTVGSFGSGKQAFLEALLNNRMYASSYEGGLQVGHVARIPKEIQIPEIYFNDPTVKSLKRLEKELKKTTPNDAIVKNDASGTPLKTKSQLSKVTNLERVRKVFESTGKGGLAEYDDKNEIENGANVFFFLSICGEGIRQGTSAAVTASEQEHPFIDNYSWKDAPVVV